MRKAVALGLVLALGGCSIGDIRRPPPAAPSTAPATSAAGQPVAPTRPRPRPADEVRRTEVDLPVGYGLQHVEFVDRNRGYAMFLGCDPASPAPAEGCPAALFVTRDGGRGWRAVPHPHPRAANHQMYAAGDTVALLAEPHGWWLSTDGGATFTHPATKDMSPPFVQALFGRYQPCCDPDDKRRVVEFAGGRMRPVPAQPPIPSVDAVASAGETLYAAGLRDGRPYAAMSTDRGRTWQPTFVAAPVDGLEMVHLMVSHRGEHAWLVGATSRFAFPYLWLYDGHGWRPSGRDGHPDDYLAVAPLDDGSVAVAGRAGPGVVAGGAYRALDWPVDGGYLRVLADGTVNSQVDRVVWLGEGTGTERRWIHVELSAG
jgi:hypothetical protein